MFRSFNSLLALPGGASPSPVMVAVLLQQKAEAESVGGVAGGQGLAGASCLSGILWQVGEQLKDQNNVNGPGDISLCWRLCLGLVLLKHEYITSVSDLVHVLFLQKYPFCCMLFVILK